MTGLIEAKPRRPIADPATERRRPCLSKVSAASARTQGSPSATQSRTVCGLLMSFKTARAGAGSSEVPGGAPRQGVAQEGSAQLEVAVPEQPAVGSRLRTLPAIEVDGRPRADHPEGSCAAAWP